MSVVVDHGAGGHLRAWRRRRGLSQLAVAIECGTSTRHLSFVETGRARPSPDLVLQLARLLRPTNRQLAACLLAAGHAPRHLPELDDGGAADPVDEVDAAVVAVVDRHAPDPAYAFDADWRMVHLNDGARWLCTRLPPEVWLVDGDPDGGVDMIAALAHPDGVLAHVDDPARVGATVLRQLRAEQLTNPGLRERVDALERSLRRRFPGPGPGPADGPPAAEPTYRLDLVTPDGPLAFRVVQVVVGLAQHLDVAAPRVELLLPVDDRTRAAMAGQAEARRRATSADER